jgi:hypothetical protein
MPDTSPREHLYYAESIALTGSLQLPLVQEIRAHSSLKLPEKGGYFSQHSDAYRLAGVLSYKSSYTQVAGNSDVKEGHGWSTLSTSVIEGLNVLDIVTADRVVAQLTTDHPLVGYVPSITFLGTRFENLRIGGHPVKLELDLNLFGAKPADDRAYTSDTGFIKRVASQYEGIRAHQNLPAELRQRYNQLPTTSDRQESIDCSLVNHADGSYPGQSFGHVIDVPNFGKIHLACVRLEQSDFDPKTGAPKKTLIKLTMLDLHMGCLAAGDIGAGGLTNNGGTRP